VSNIVNRFFAILLTIFISLNAEIWSYSGDVYASSGANFLYKGLIDSSNKIAIKKNDCYNSAGEIILKEHTEYLEKTCEVLNAHIQDFRTGKEEIIIDQGDSYLIRYKKNASTDFVEKEIKKEKNVIHPTVLAMFMQKKMTTILKGNPLKVNLLLPNRQCTIGFQLLKQGTKNIDGVDCYKLILEPESLIIRQFVNPIYFYVKKDDPSVLVKYEGVIAPTDDEGNSQTGQIMFSFE
jgi:hypothetical protein